MSKDSIAGVVSGQDEQEGAAQEEAAEKTTEAVEAFTLDEGFDYDNAVLTSRYPDPAFAPPLDLQRRGPPSGAWN
jgi:hypothetical protein